MSETPFDAPAAGKPPPPFDPAVLVNIPPEQLSRYDVAGPRYTSYPTAPAWSADFGAADTERAYRESATSGRALSIYVHIPFCESLCIYCGCSVIITKQRQRAEAYIERVEREIDRVSALCGGESRATVQIAWGGGTPTYLAPDQMRRLMAHIIKRFPLAADAEVAIEVDPRVTTQAHIQAMADSGCNRISMGLQDFDKCVQEEIHRVQTFEETRDLIGWARAAGIDSVNVDLVYGLPLQTLERFENTIDRVFDLAPDRISAFSYAHVPWLKPGQKKFDEATILKGPEKFAIFARLTERLCGGGYRFIGMDHFAKPDNELSLAQDQGKLWRNFQGFTTQAGTDLIGFGVTAIGSVGRYYIQNEKDISAWNKAQDDGRLSTIRGLRMSDDDLVRQQIVHQLMCRYRLSKAMVREETGVEFDEYFADCLPALPGLVDDGLIVMEDDGFALTSIGRCFVRNVCMLFDAHLPEEGKRRFSRTV